MKNIVKSLPQTPGVYIFRDKNKKALYVGKAVNLKSRVSSYFQNKEALTPKTRMLVSKIESIEHISVDNEIEALLLESELIKRYRPIYNINLKDDKFYKFIKIESIKLQVKGDRKVDKKESVKKISTSRKKDEQKGIYFGPYPETASIDIILKTLRKIFPYRDCSTAKFTRYRKSQKPCLYGHIGLCPMPCQSTNGNELNNKNIKQITEYLRGNRKQLFNRIRKEMKLAAKNHEFEKAATLRDQLASYEYLTQQKREIGDYVSSPNLLKDTRREALKKLLTILGKNGLPIKKGRGLSKFRIETYDISNIQGKNAVGSMVVLTGGNPDKQEYRRFKIKFKDTPDDFAMMQEVLSRRFKKQNREKWTDPNLIVIDGGKGQLSATLTVLKKLKITIPTIGLAKRNEEIVISTEASFKVLSLPKDSAAITLLTLARNEAHRFAIAYYRNLHRKNLLS